MCRAGWLCWKEVGTGGRGGVRCLNGGWGMREEDELRV